LVLVVVCQLSLLTLLMYCLIDSAYWSTGDWIQVCKSYGAVACTHCTFV